MSSETITCLVAARNADGTPELIRVQIAATPEEIAEGVHHDKAREQVENKGYTVFPTDVVFDSQATFCRKLLAADCFFDV
jgi:hypothetical protein